eukprot:jgi/Botrbrau1/17154/Bobra.0157s0048.1
MLPWPWVLFLLFILGIFLCKKFITGIFRTLYGIALHPFDEKPIRIDLPLFFFPIDMVFLKRARDIHAAVLTESTSNPCLGRIHCLSTAELPYWLRLYFKSSRFLAQTSDSSFSWFLPLEKKNYEYGQRRTAHDKNLAVGNVNRKCVLEVMRLALNDDKEGLQFYTANMISRLFGGKDVPLDIVQAATSTISGFDTQILLRPFPFLAAMRANQKLF